MNTYKITYRAVDGQFRTYRTTGRYPESALQAFRSWLTVVGDTVWAEDLRETPVVEWESSVM